LASEALGIDDAGQAAGCSGFAPALPPPGLESSTCAMMLAGFASLAPLPAIVEPMQPLTRKDQVGENLLGASRALFPTTWPARSPLAEQLRPLMRARAGRNDKLAPSHGCRSPDRERRCSRASCLKTVPRDWRVDRLHRQSQTPGRSYCWCRPSPCRRSLRVTTS
jgi:hypothetical protein